MKLEYANYICPNCKNGNYMRWLGGHSAEYDAKCINCNSYFTIEELRVRQTNGDKIRSMSDEELAEFLEMDRDCYRCTLKCIGHDGKPLSRAACMLKVLDWLKEECAE